MGIQLEKRGKTLIAHMLGLSIQKFIYQHHFQSDLLADVQSKHQQLELNYINNADSHATTVLMLFDERLGRTWLNAGLAKGEIFSITQTISEAKVFSQDDNYHPCR